MDYPYLMPRPSAKEKLLEAAMASFRFDSYKSCSIEDSAAKREYSNSVFLVV
jgi:hypothetical protein